MKIRVGEWAFGDIFLKRRRENIMASEVTGKVEISTELW